VSAAVLGVAAVCWLIAGVLHRLALVSFAVAAALLLSALVRPAARGLEQVGAPAWLAALTCVLGLVSVLAGIGSLVWVRTSTRLDDLGPALTDGIDRVRSWLVGPPLGLDAGQVDNLRDRLVAQVNAALPGPVAGAQTAVSVLGGLLLVLFLIFFFVKDGEGMWRWVLGRVPDRNRLRFDGAGRRAWTVVSRYVRGVVTVAAMDAVLIGAGLLVLGVPLWLSLTLLTFFGAFVPYVGAVLSGAVAVLVTLVTDGARDAVIILVIVLVVQQVEGNVLQPLVMRRAVHLHPVVTLLAVLTGTLLLGIPGAVLAVPLTAAIHQVYEHLRPEPVSEGWA
jgi:predicted PurR-regulated permease PerM